MASDSTGEASGSNLGVSSVGLDQNTSTQQNLGEDVQPKPVGISGSGEIAQNHGVPRILSHKELLWDQ